MAFPMKSQALRVSRACVWKGAEFAVWGVA